MPMNWRRCIVCARSSSAAVSNGMLRSRNRASSTSTTIWIPLTFLRSRRRTSGRMRTPSACGRPDHAGEDYLRAPWKRFTLRVPRHGRELEVLRRHLSGGGEGTADRRTPVRGVAATRGVWTGLHHSPSGVTSYSLGGVRKDQDHDGGAGTGSGRTTLANAIIAEVVVTAPDDRMVILEDRSKSSTLRKTRSRSIPATRSTWRGCSRAPCVCVLTASSSAKSAAERRSHS